QLSPGDRPNQVLWKRAWSSASPRALRCALARLLLQASDECAQRRCCRRSLAACAPRRGRERWGRDHLGEAAVSLDVLAPTDDAIGKRDARLPAHELAHLKARCAFAEHIEPATIALGREEHPVVPALDHFHEVCIELYDRTTAH